MQDRNLFKRKPVAVLDIKGIFELAAGHPAKQQTRTIVYKDVPASFTEINDGRTLSGRLKPGSFALRPTKRTEQFFV